MFVHDCAAGGSDCRQVLKSAAHVDDWNNGVENWVFKDLPLGNLNHTFAAGRTLRVRLMFRHKRMWIALTGGHAGEADTEQRIANGHGPGGPGSDRR